jgi:hypothetical protein
MYEKSTKVDCMVGSANQLQACHSEGSEESRSSRISLGYRFFTAFSIQVGFGRLRSGSAHFLYMLSMLHVLGVRTTVSGYKMIVNLPSCFAGDAIIDIARETRKHELER